jgi:endonuclease-3 related protein
MTSKLLEIYDYLLSLYGHQGWWPLLDFQGTNPTKTGSISGYHPKDYSYPNTENQKFEIICGAILTQNTNWINVEKALVNLQTLTNFVAKSVIDLDDEILKTAIKPAGYFNQKAKKLKIVAEFFVKSEAKIPSRDELLGLWGIGPETADSILLYAYKQPEFVVDAYTRRIFFNLGLIKENDKYADIKKYFENSLDKDYKLYQEYHALIVEHAKNLSTKK